MTLSFSDVAVIAALFLVIGLLLLGLGFWLMFRWDKAIERKQDWEFCVDQFRADWEEYQMERAAGDDGEGVLA